MILFYMSNVEIGKMKVSLLILIVIVNVFFVLVDIFLCDNVFFFKVIFEKEVKDIFLDCDEYEICFLVELLKLVKIVICKDREICK